MPRTTRSTPTLLAAVEAGTTSVSVPALPVEAPRPNPNRALATWVDSSTPLEQLPCFKQGALGAGAVLDLTRAILATGSSCAAGAEYCSSSVRRQQSAGQRHTAWSCDHEK